MVRLPLLHRLEQLALAQLDVWRWQRSKALDDRVPSNERRRGALRVYWKHGRGNLCRVWIQPDGKPAVNMISFTVPKLQRRWRNVGREDVGDLNGVKVKMYPTQIHDSIKLSPITSLIGEETKITLIAVDDRAAVRLEKGGWGQHLRQWPSSPFSHVALNFQPRVSQSICLKLLLSIYPSDLAVHCYSHLSLHSTISSPPAVIFGIFSYRRKGLVRHLPPSSSITTDVSCQFANTARVFRFYSRFVIARRWKTARDG